ncbi:MAG TPA: phosphatase PAP2 family protein [Actinomycetes bacterium]|nr:phosphatase PAP2 family protein [Actinomycetes bacterium]
MSGDRPGARQGLPWGGPAGVAAALRRADLALFKRIAGAHNPVLDRTMPALSRAADWSRLWLGLSLLLAASGRPAWRRAALRGVAAIALASSSVNGLAKLSVNRRRPPMDHVPPARRVHRAPVTTAFPSGHSASAAAFATAVATQAPELAAPAGLLAAAVAGSRVWTGAHYPGDVLAGAALGAGIGLAVGRARRGRRRGRRRP